MSAPVHVLHEGLAVEFLGSDDGKGAHPSQIVVDHHSDDLAEELDGEGGSQRRAPLDQEVWVVLPDQRQQKLFVEVFSLVMFDHRHIGIVAVDHFCRENAQMACQPLQDGRRFAPSGQKGENLV